MTPVAALIAIGVWWTSNTIAHHAIHRPPFRRRSVNRLFAAGLSAATGIPQAAWRDRHLAHHAGKEPSVRLTSELLLDISFVFAVWITMAEMAPVFFATVYVPGYVAGLILCGLHGYYEHAGGTTSYYGRAYNALLFNDGYHVEHHMFPSAHWRELPRHRAAEARTSAWPAPLRWFEIAGLEHFESIVLRSPQLQRFVLRAHERAFRRLLFTSVPPMRPPSLLRRDGGDYRIVIVGGGLFPRSAIVLRRLLPRARLTIIDANRRHLEIARRFLPDGIACRHERFDGTARDDCDMLVLPLSFSGSREQIYTCPAAPVVVAHDWLWRRRGLSRIVSVALLKRVNLVRRL